MRIACFSRWAARAGKRLSIFSAMNKMMGGEFGKTESQVRAIPIGKRNFITLSCAASFVRRIIEIKTKQFEIVII
ncbi:MAG: hypothetical protein JWM99_410 [Verrucomicrobiales bacterium]|nr:hypothetical protein [Verrucomicrobiales bacterium]